MNTADGFIVDMGLIPNGVDSDKSGLQSPPTRKAAVNNKNFTSLKPDIL
ncbi:MAG: hypothetical protein OXM61_13580 [Candidatus Poribacteria bacterium]|nr:hypothetical protein [Candidatus Poribacteria bacterium]